MRTHITNFFETQAFKFYNKLFFALKESEVPLQSTRQAIIWLTFVKFQSNQFTDEIWEAVLRFSADAHRILQK